MTSSLVIDLIVLAVLAAGIIFFFVNRSKKKNEDECAQQRHVYGIPDSYVNACSACPAKMMCKKYNSSEKTK